MFAREECAGWAIGICLAVVWLISGALGARADTPAADSYAGGDGTAGAPYQIATLAQLRRLSETSGDWASHFELTADIDASDTATWNVGDHDGDGGTPDEAMGFSPIGLDSGTPFSGDLDGKGYTIASLYINRPGYDLVGVFGYATSGELTGLELADVNVTGNQFTGGLAGHASSAVTSCRVTGAVEGEGTVGGLIGTNFGSISSCCAEGTVRGPSLAGGLVGDAWGPITSCYANATVNASYDAGGLVGNAGDLIGWCYATGAVTGWDRVGGLIGSGDSCNITSCYATGAVSGRYEVGGLAGQIKPGDITSCYATGAVRGTNNYGGLVGFGDSCNITSCYATGAVSGLYGGGLAGSLDNEIAPSTVEFTHWDTETSGKTAGVRHWSGPYQVFEGKTSAQMQQQSSFPGFDFSTTWAIVEGEARPHLQWQATALFEGVPSVPGATGFSVEEGYVYNVPGSGCVVTEYGFALREDGSDVVTLAPLATAQSLSEGAGVSLDGVWVDGLSEDTTYHYRAYAVDDSGVTHYGTERAVTTTHCPTSADGAVTTDEDVPYVFAESDFIFNDIDAGDTFGGIRITALATDGILQFNAGSWEAVTQGQEVSVADINAGYLQFRPAADGNGTPYATFEFQVADSTAGYSAASYVMTVNVTPDDPCDVDGSGAVNAVDVQFVINAALGLSVIYDCDANKDGSVNALDVQLVINAALGL